MTTANPTSKRLRVIDLSTALGEPDHPYDDLFSLRSHELRTPLANMLVFAELIGAGNLTAEQHRLCAGILVQEGRRLTVLINDALALLQRLDDDHRELDLAPLDVRSLIQRAVLAAGADDQRPISRPGAGSGDILLAGDDAKFASLLQAEFAARGLTSVRAADAEAAEHVLLDLTPRAIILDLALPGLRGEAFLTRTRAGDGSLLPVVVVTAKDLGPVEISALEAAGALAVLPKEAGAPQAAVALIAEALALDPVAG